MSQKNVKQKKQDQDDHPFERKGFWLTILQKHPERTWTLIGWCRGSRANAGCTCDRRWLWSPWRRRRGARGRGWPDALHTGGRSSCFWGLRCFCFLRCLPLVCQSIISNRFLHLKMKKKLLITIHLSGKIAILCAMAYYLHNVYLWFVWIIPERFYF